jgi:glycerophosphoryl diester phosphodiesterase
MPTRMQIFGHRGAPAYAPENTLESFRKALELGVDVIELDVYTLHTGEVVVIHDESVERTTDGEKFVWEYSLKELRGLNAGAGQSIPLLTEVLDIIDKKAGLNIELKGLHTAAPVAKILKRYISEEGWSPHKFLVSSFILQELTVFMALMPEVRAGALYEHFVVPRYAAFASKPSAYSINPDAAVVTPEMVRQIHSRGLKVFAWNVKNRATAARMERYGVDGIFTDYPDILEQHWAGPKMLRSRLQLASAGRF